MEWVFLVGGDVGEVMLRFDRVTSVLKMVYVGGELYVDRGEGGAQCYVL